jgi:hypothetical protein
MIKGLYLIEYGVFLIRLAFVYMVNLVRTNQYLGWTSIFGFIITLSATIVFLDPQVVLVAIIPVGISLPFFIINSVSVLNRSKYQKQISNGVRIGIFLIVGIPTLFPLFFDFEFIYVSLIGVGLGIVMWFLRNSIEIQLIIFNSISCIFVMLWAWLAIANV